MTDKNYPIYIKTGFMNKKLIGNILVKEKLTKVGVNYNTYSVEYHNAQITEFFKRIFLKSWMKDGTIKLSDKAKKKFAKEVVKEQ